MTASPALLRRALAFAIGASFALTVTALGADHARAGTLSYDAATKTASFLGAPGEVNVVSIQDNGLSNASYSVEFSDHPGYDSPAPTQLQLAPSTSGVCARYNDNGFVDDNYVRCQLDVKKWVIALGDRNDALKVVIWSPDGTRNVPIEAFGGDDDDSIELVSEAATSTTKLHGGAGSDGFSARWGSPQVLGEGGSDLFFGDSGKGNYDGGPESDGFVLMREGTANLTTGRATSPGAGASTQLDARLSNIEDLDAGASSVYLDGGPFRTLIGDAGPNRLSASGKWLSGGSTSGRTGTVTLIGAGGDDELVGSKYAADTTTASYAQFATGRVAVNQGTTAPQNTGGAGTDTLVNIENVTGTSFDNDILFGDNNANKLDGGAGNNDVLVGCGGPDKLIGGPGDDAMADSFLICDGGVSNDTFVSDSGTDTVNGGNGFDTLDFSSRPAAINVDLRGKATGIDTVKATTNADTVITPDQALTIYGLGGADTLSAGKGGAVFYGGDGKDTLTGNNTMDVMHGEGDNDTMYGLNGNDIYDGGHGADKMSEKWWFQNMITNGNDYFDAVEDPTEGVATADTIIHCGVGADTFEVGPSDVKVASCNP